MSYFVLCDSKAYKLFYILLNFPFNFSIRVTEIPLLEFLAHNLTLRLFSNIVLLNRLGFLKRMLSSSLLCFTADLYWAIGIWPEQNALSLSLFIKEVGRSVWYWEVSHRSFPGEVSETTCVSWSYRIKSLGSYSRASLLPINNMLWAIIFQRNWFPEECKGAQ